MAVAYKILQNGVSATGDGEAVQLVGANSVYEFLYIQIEGITTATVTFEATINESDWFAVSMENLATSYRSTTATEDGSYAMRVGGIRQFRARVSSWASGAIYVYASADDSGDGSSTIASLWPRYGDYLVHDEFTDTVAAGSVNGTAATPGPGTRAVTDTENKLSVGSGVMALALQVTPSWSDLGISYGPIARAAGVALLQKWQSDDTGDSLIAIGFDAQATPRSVTLQVYSWRGGGLLGIAGSTISGAWVPANDTPYQLAIVLRSTGAFCLVKGGTYTNWTLIYVAATNATASLYAKIDSYSVPCSTDYLRVLQLPAPFDTDDGLATDVLSGSVSAGTTFTHEADCLIEFTVDTLPSASGTLCHFRKQDANNYWRVVVNSSGNLNLDEYVGGVGTLRATAAGVVSNGHRIVIIAEGTTVKGYSNDTLRWTYSSATNLATATAGEVFSLGTGGAVSDLSTYPYGGSLAFATYSWPVSVPAGTTFTHTADCLIEFTVTTLGSADAHRFRFRKVDSANYWYVYVGGGTGNFNLYEVVSGVPTSRGSVAGVVADGHRIVIVAEGTTIKGYSNNVLRWTYSSATNFATATAGELITLSTGGAVSDIKTWPRELDGIAASILNKASA